MYRLDSYGNKMIFLSTFVVSILYLCSLVSSQTDQPIIATPQGQVQGVTLTNNNGLTYYGFRGIPYGQPPTGVRRFMRTVPADPWTGVLDASVPPPVCYQFGDDASDRIGTEDCLYLNVYIPELPEASTEDRSVMVWFYGGAFQTGYANESSFGSGKLMGYDVITVTVNFRSGALGFLSTADDVIPGNQALWDQVQSLRWIQENIAAFGGDPDSVTIFGQSSGAMSVSSLFVSPQTKGLFHAVIAESGSQILPFTYQPNPLPFAKTLAAHLNCSTDNTSLMLPCLQSVSVETLYDAQGEFDAVPIASPLYFIPVLDPQVADGLLPDEPMNLIKNEQYNMVPYMSGLTQNEGLGFALGIMLSGVHFDRDFVNNSLSQLVMNFTFLTGDKLEQVTSLVYDEYFSDIDFDNTTAIGEGVSAVISDTIFNTGHFQMMTLLPKGDDYPSVYSYLFSYHGEYMGLPRFGDTIHGDELVYIFDVAADNGGILDAQDNITSERILTFWTTFAKTGNPNPTSSDVISVTWDAVTSSDSVPYINLDSELTMEENFRSDRMEFWQNYILPIVFSNTIQ